MNQNCKALKLLWNKWSDGPKKLLVSPSYKSHVAEFISQLNPDDVIELDIMD